MKAGCEKCIRAAVALVAVVCGRGADAHTPSETPAFVAASFATDSLYFLDRGMRPISRFAVSDPFPNAVTATDDRLYAGYFFDASVVAYTYGGRELSRWSSPVLGRITGLAALGDVLAVSADTSLYLFNAATGTPFAQLQANDSIEGLAFDGHFLWSLGSELVARDPVTGVVEHILPDAALGCPFAGTGIASAGVQQLMLSCSDGRWFRVSSTTGAVLAEGNNGLDMFDLAALPVPEPRPADLLLLGLPMITLIGPRKNASRKRKSVVSR